jgi:hypothetical protein
MLGIWNAMRSGDILAYVAPADGQPFTVPRNYWNWADNQSLEILYRGMPDSFFGRGCPILLSRQAFDTWRTTTNVVHDQAKRKKVNEMRGRPGPAPDSDWPTAMAWATSECIAAGYRRPLKRGEQAAIKDMLLNYMAEREKEFSEATARNYAKQVISVLPDS